jgi:hypothetical protein
MSAGSGPSESGPAGNGAADSGAVVSGAAESNGGKQGGLLRMRAAVGGALAPVRTAVASVGRAWRRIGPAVPGPGAVRPADVAGALLARLTVLPALLIVAWLVPGLPLLLAGDFAPLPELVIAVPLAVALIVNGLRTVPARWPVLLPGGRTGVMADWPTWLGLLGTVAVVAALVGWQLGEGAQALIVVRDPGTYFQAGYWIAQHGSLPIPDSVSAFGGVHPGLTFASSGFLARGNSVVPAAMPGLPLLLAGGSWVHGVSGASALGPVLGGLATLTFAGLVARLVGPQWAPAGALVLGLSLPQQYVSRTSLTETALQITLFGGLCLLVDALTLRRAPIAAASRAVAAAQTSPAAETAAAETAAAGAGNARLGADLAATAALPAVQVAGSAGVVDWRPQPWWSEAWQRFADGARRGGWFAPPRVLAALAGLTLGLGLVFSLDAIVYLLPVIPFGCVLVAGRRVQASPFLALLGFGVIYGLLGCFLLERPFLDTVGKTAALGGVVAVLLIALSVIVLLVLRLGAVRRIGARAIAARPLRWLPGLAALVVIAVLVGFAVRPYVQTVRGTPSPAVYAFISSLQRAQGLRVDPTRLYSEQTLYWVIWYIGLPTVLLGAVGLAVLARRCLRALLTWRDPDRVWRSSGPALAIICIGSAAVLWAPDIVPDQPWASRRLVVLAIPGLIIGALWGASALARWGRDRGARPATAGVAGAFCVAAMLLPTLATTFGVGLSHSGKAGGLQPVAQGIALQRTGAGEMSAVAALCAQIPQDAAVVIVDRVTTNEFAPVIRGMCGVPVASMAGQPRSAVQTVANAVAAAGRRPLLLASGPGRLAGFGAAPTRVVNLVTAGDPHQLTEVPTAPSPVHYQVWMTSPVSGGIGA